MLTTVILTLIMCVLLVLMIWSAAFFLPWKGLMEFFPEDIKEKAIDHHDAVCSPADGVDLYTVLMGVIYEETDI